MWITSRQKRWVILLLLIFPVISFAQNKASVKGRVMDTLINSPIELATVALVSAKDTSLISYTVTQKDGAFNLSGLPVNVETRLIISSMGYSTLRRTLLLKPAEARDVGKLLMNNKVLNEVSVKAERAPVVQKRDTLEFNTEAFKTRPNAVVEDLLKLLPGVQVNVDGSILVNGKTVTKMLIDGKRFFGTDPSVASRNLDADLVSTVQVYDDREEDPDHRLSDFEVGKIINLKLKRKVRKSTFGKIYAGAGTRGRYEAGGILNTFRDTLQVSVIGLTNNLTRTGFSSSEVYAMGGFNRSGGSQPMDGTFGGNGDGGIERMRSAGFNINDDFSKKIKTNLMYWYTNYNKDYDKKLRNDQTLDQTSLTTLSHSISQVRDNRHSTSTLIEWIPDAVQRLRADARLDIMPNGFTNNGSTSTSNPQALLTDLLNKTEKNGLAHELTENILYYRKLKTPGAAITVNQQYYFNRQGYNEYDYNDLISYTSTLPTSVQDRYINTGINTTKATLSATLNTPLSKAVGNELSIQSQYLSAGNRAFTYDKGAAGVYDVFLGDQSSNLLRTDYKQNVQNMETFTVDQKTSLRVGLNLETQSLTNNFNGAAPNSNKHYTYLFPVFRLTKAHYELNYGEAVMLPDIGQMQPATRQISQVETLTGNPELQPSHKRNLNFRYHNYDLDKQTSLDIGSNFTVTGNNIVQVSTKDANGIVTSTFANKNGGWNAGFDARTSRQFKKSRTWQISLDNGLGGRYDQRSFFFNGDGGVQYNYGIMGAQNVTISYQSIVNLNTTYFILEEITRYGGVIYPSVHNLRHRVQSIGSVNWPDNFIFDMQYQYDYNPQIAPGFSRSSNVLNLAATLLMLKQNRGQIKLSVYDLFNQNIRTYRYAANNSVTSGEQQILRRYFLLTFAYKISTTR